MDLSSHFKRREFNGTTLALLGAAAVPALLPQAALAQSPVPQAGKEYLVLDRAAPIEAPAGKIEIVDFFWYSCPHCNAFEPAFEAWAKKLPADVSLRRVPVSFRADFKPQQKLFYTLEALGKVNDWHVKVFNAIHVEHVQLTSEAQILAWADKQGIDKAKFASTYGSFSVDAKANTATQLQDQYKVAGVPALGVAGRYYTDGEQAGSMERALQVVDYLVGKSRKGA